MSLINNEMNNLHSGLRNIDIYPSPGQTKLFTAYTSWVGKHIVDECHFFFVMEGQLILTVENHNYIVRPGQLVLLPSNRQHTYILPPSRHLVAWRTVFKARCEGEDFFEKYGFSEDNHVVDVEDVESLVSLFKEAAFSVNFNNKLSIYLNCASKITNILALYVDERMKKSNSVNSEFKDVIAYMKEHLNENITLPQLSQMLHMEPTYFVRKFKKKIGVSPMKFFNDLKIKKAMDILVTTDFPISKTGKCIGIDSPLYFTQFFNKNVGASPSEYRKLFK